MTNYGYQTPTYAPYMQPQYPSPQPAQVKNGLIWVQGEAGAKSYLVAPNTTLLLMDSESDRFFLKSADASGMPLPLRTFHYVEDTATDNPVYVSKADFDAFRQELDGRLAALRKEVPTNAE